MKTDFGIISSGIIINNRNKKSLSYFKSTDEMEMQITWVYLAQKQT